MGMLRSIPTTQSATFFRSAATLRIKRRFLVKTATIGGVEGSGAPGAVNGTGGSALAKRQECGTSRALWARAVTVMVVLNIRHR
jgi:hypothetical protein